VSLSEQKTQQNRRVIEGALHNSRHFLAGTFGKENKATPIPYSETASSRPLAAAVRAIPDLAALIFSAYCSGIRVDFHPQLWITFIRVNLSGVAVTSACLLCSHGQDVTSSY
jgi:hypothetical protein